MRVLMAAQIAVLAHPMYLSVLALDTPQCVHDVNLLVTLEPKALKVMRSPLGG
jgi:hypothetical protein